MAASAPSDETALLERLRDGDEAAFEELVRSHLPSLRATARRLMRDPSEADDAVQDAFISAFRALGEFRGDARLRTWLHRILVNACLARLRKHHRFDVADDATVAELLPRFVDGDPRRHRADVVPAWSEPADVLAARAETRALVRTAIQGLPEPHRTVLLLRDIEELSGSEVAALLGLQDGTVKVRLHRARQSLRRVLERELGGVR